jgi:hypothetical protein
MKHKPLSEMTAEEIYLCYVNDFITVTNMAQWYGVAEWQLSKLIEQGRYLNHQKKQQWKKN